MVCSESYRQSTTNGFDNSICSCDTLGAAWEVNEKNDPAIVTIAIRAEIKRDAKCERFAPDWTIRLQI
jgi:hypothetical protein